MTGLSSRTIRSPRLAILLSSPGAGGVDRMLVHVARGIGQFGIGVDFITSPKSARYLDGVPPEVRVVDLQPRAQAMVERVHAHLVREGIGVLLTAKTRDDDLAFRIKRKLGERLFWVMRVGTVLSWRLEARREYALRRWWKIRQVRRLSTAADRVICVSRGVADDLTTLADVPAARVEVIPNPTVPPEMDALAAAEVDHPWLSPDAPPFILAVGGLRRQKDFATLLRAFARLPAVDAWHLMILGEGRQRTRLQRLAVQLGVADRLAMPGFVRNPYAYMVKARLFILSSLWEGSPNALIEALALGVPAVSTDCPSGPREILQGGRYGPLVPPGDPASLADAMFATLKRPPAPAFLREAALEYTLERGARRYLAAMGLSGLCHAAGSP